MISYHDSNPNEIIPISFDMYKILEDNLNSFDNNNNFGNSKYLIEMHSQTKTSGTKLPEVHGVEKGLKPKLKTRKATCHSQTRKIREVRNRSRKSRIKEEKT